MMQNAKALHTGMTVNERLISAGLLNAFEEACHKRDWNAVAIFLVKVDLTPKQVEHTIAFFRNTLKNMIFNRKGFNNLIKV